MPKFVVGPNQMDNPIVLKDVLILLHHEILMFQQLIHHVLQIYVMIDQLILLLGLMMLI